MISLLKEDSSVEERLQALKFLPKHHFLNSSSNPADPITIEGHREDVFHL
jgi:hypothetical protein